MFIHVYIYVYVTGSAAISTANISSEPTRPVWRQAPSRCWRAERVGTPRFSSALSWYPGSRLGWPRHLYVEAHIPTYISIYIYRDMCMYMWISYTYVYMLYMCIRTCKVSCLHAHINMTSGLCYAIALRLCLGCRSHLLFGNQVLLANQNQHAEPCIA